MEVGERRGGDEDQMPGTAGIYRLEETEGEERERKRFIPSVGTANLAYISYMVFSLKAYRLRTPSNV